MPLDQLLAQWLPIVLGRSLKKVVEINLSPINIRIHVIVTPCKSIYTNASLTKHHNELLCACTTFRQRSGRSPRRACQLRGQPCWHRQPHGRGPQSRQPCESLCDVIVKMMQWSSLTHRRRTGSSCSACTRRGSRSPWAPREPSMQGEQSWCPCASLRGIVSHVTLHIMTASQHRTVAVRLVAAEAAGADVLGLASLKAGHGDGGKLQGVCERAPFHRSLAWKNKRFYVPWRRGRRGLWVVCWLCQINVIASN